MMKKNSGLIVKSSSKLLRSTPRKLNLVAGLIRNKSVSFANMQLRFCKKKAAIFIMKVLNTAVANAQNNYGLNVDNLYIKKILVGKSITLRRMNPKAMGKANRIGKLYSKITIELKEL